jgi:hypothetical protein
MIVWDDVETFLKNKKGDYQLVVALEAQLCIVKKRVRRVSQGASGHLFLESKNIMYSTAPPNTMRVPTRLTSGAAQFHFVKTTATDVPATKRSRSTTQSISLKSLVIILLPT